MVGRTILAALLALGAGVGAGAAQVLPVTTSAQADAVAVTLYRDPQQRSGGIDRSAPGGFALITETRTIDLPAGRARLRFEGVASGMLPVTAIVQGLPGGLIEKNRDRALLSPAALLDGSLGRQVMLRRTDPATGRTREERAVIRSGAAGAVVLQTASGIEALRCSGLPETLVYDAIPDGLSATPTLSVETDSPAPTRATVQLSYLATDFDWAADYILRLAPDYRRMELFAWATLANANDESFADARTQLVAGRLNRETGGEVTDTPAPELAVACWPYDSTSSAAETGLLPPPPPLPMVMMAPVAVPAMAEAAMVRRVVQEELGDLKLYRLSEPVTVAARSQKQVTMLERKAVAVTPVHRFRIALDGVTGRVVPAQLVLRMRNREDQGLGVPLPSGGVAIHSGERLLAQGRLRDVAVDEAFEIEAGEDGRVTLLREADTLRLYNMGQDAVTVEIQLSSADAARVSAPRGRIMRRDGQPLWTATVAGQGEAALRFRPRRGD